MTNKKQPDLSNFFKDKDGKVIIVQWPNIPLYGWAIFNIISLFLSKRYLKIGSEELSLAFLFTWAYLEAKEGVNYFRKSLGFIILIFIIISFFTKIYL